MQGGKREGERDRSFTRNCKIGAPILKLSPWRPNFSVTLPLPLPLAQLLPWKTDTTHMRVLPATVPLL